MKDISLFGIQGAGKGTQAKKIIEKYGDKFSYFEAGNILRALKSTDNAIGNYVKDVIDKGNLVDDSVITSLFDTYMVTLHKEQAMLLDGFPRKLEQMYMFLERMKKSKRDFIAIYLDLPEEEAVQRLTGRKICKGCGEIYNINNKGDIQECEKCGGEVRKREDDQEDIIRQRINLYMEETMPVIKYFEKEGLLKRVDANNSSAEIFFEIESILN